MPPAQAAPGPTIIAIAAGYRHTCALTSGGGVKCWGSNGYGQLGDSSTIDSNVPVDVTGLATGVTAISASWGTCAVTNSGGVKCWGPNDFGQLGDGTTISSNVPVDVAGLPDGVASIATGNTFTCALTIRGAVKCWGANHAFADTGSLNPVRSSLTPIDIEGLETGITTVAASYAHACVLTSGGGVKCWGPNHRGELGNGTTTAIGVTVDVSGLASGVEAISAGLRHTCALLSGGGVRCWGSNGYGQLGTDTNTDSSVPVEVSGLASRVSAIVLGHIHSCALLGGDGVTCWGSNSFGQLGYGTIDSSTPVDVEGLATVVSGVAAGAQHTCALVNDGGVSCWGDNQFGQLGNGTRTKTTFPVAVDFESPLP